MAPARGRYKLKLLHHPRGRDPRSKTASNEMPSVDAFYVRRLAAAGDRCKALIKNRRSDLE